MKSTYKSLFEIIEESVEHGRGGWDIDPAHPAKGSYEDRFRAGDKQIPLWEISRCIKNNTPIPEWAGIAFRVALERVVTCQRTWDQAFGKVPAGGRYRKSLLTAAKSVKVCERIEQLHAPVERSTRTYLIRLAKNWVLALLGALQQCRTSGKSADTFRDKFRADISS